MPDALWGATAVPRLIVADHPLWLVWVVLYGALLLTYLVRTRHTWQRWTARGWGATVALLAAAVIAGQLLLFQGGDVAAPVSWPMFGVVPLLLAAATLDPVAAVLVGLGGGLGRALWGSGSVLEPFQFAFVGWLAASWLQQVHRSQLYDWLRRPFIAGPLALAALLPLGALDVFVHAYASFETGLPALDAALLATGSRVGPLLAEGFLSGVVVALVLYGVPRWQRRRPSTRSASPGDRVSSRLLRDFATVALPLLLLLGAAILFLAGRRAQQQTVAQMALQAEQVAAQIPGYREYREALLAQLGANPNFVDGNATAREAALAALGANGAFDALLLADETGRVDAAYPASLTRELAAAEVAAIGVLTEAAPATIVAHEEGVVFARRLAEGTAVVGRAAPIQVAAASSSTDLSLTTYVVDDRDAYIAASDKSLIGKQFHQAPPSRSVAPGSMPGELFFNGDAFQNGRFLLYIVPEGQGERWKVMVTVPFASVLGRTLELALFPLLSLIIVIGALAGQVVWQGQQMSGPLEELVSAARRIARGRLDTPITASGHDELGQLGDAFVTMQRSLKRRLDELGLLVRVGQAISGTLDIETGMPTILQGTIRGSGAAGARALVLNPLDRFPLTFSEGPAGEMMAPFDRRIMTQVRQQRELVLTDQRQIRDLLGAQQGRPIHALLAISLGSKERFQGMIWLVHYAPHRYDETELNLVRTLASQASVLVENARLFASASSGRRRLAAVLASTTDAVIVTDQTERLILINPAAERTFNIRASQVIGRAIGDVFADETLLTALKKGQDRVRNAEITTNDGRTFYVNASPISSRDAAMGRVAVLHDITHLKEVDAMKSEFVATVSHDLRGPLSFMRGYTTMLPMVGDLNDKQEEYVEKIMHGIERMSTMVSDLLDLRRLEAGIKLDVSDVQLERLLNYVATDHHHPARNQDIELVVDAPTNLPTVQGDAQLLRQAIANLVGNALKYAPESEIISLGARADNGEVIVSVADQGPGIDESDQPRLFESFFRVVSREGEVVQGSGLGLAIVKSIAERHGGRVWCQSKVGEGSTFFMALPLTQKNR